MDSNTSLTFGLGERWKQAKICSFERLISGCLDCGTAGESAEKFSLGSSNKREDNNRLGQKKENHVPYSSTKRIYEIKKKRRQDKKKDGTMGGLCFVRGGVRGAQVAPKRQEPIGVPNKRQ